MRETVIAVVALVITAVIIIPGLVVCGFKITGVSRPADERISQTEKPVIGVYIVKQNKVVKMDLEEYVKGVVAAEMPAEFELEALKAQAVAARTYAVKHMHRFGGPGVSGQPEADVSTDHGQDQAWQDENELKARWGLLNYPRYWRKIDRAVMETAGLIITYGGEPISAVFHSTCGERTAAAKEVWGFDYPYLQSVSCQWDKASPRYTDRREISFGELAQSLGDEAGVLAATQSGTGAVAQVIDITESGRVGRIRIGSQILTGLEARAKLGLRSANFTVEATPDGVVFHTVGYGHGVGLCQYGANGMAKAGRDFRQIITYYYTGVGLQNIYGP